jgi:hypothetical protein
LERHFDRLQLFDQPNVLFHADPMWRLRSFSSGNGWSDRTLVHPHLGNYFAIPNIGIARLATIVGLYQGDEVLLRRSLALIIAPAFAAASCVLVFTLLYLLGFAIWKALLIALLQGASFSQLIFGSIPDHFAIGGFCVAAACLLAVDMMRNQGRIRWFCWLLLGIFTLGITITNALWVGILFCASLLSSHRDWKVMLKYASIWSVIIVGVTFVTAEAINAVVRLRLDRPDVSAFFLSKAYARDMNEEGILKIVKAPGALANSFSPAELGTTSNPMGHDSAARPYRFTLEKSSRIMPNLAVAVLIGLGLTGYVSAGGQHAVLGMSCAAILFLNLLFHSVFGTEFFAFSQHWLVSASVLLAGIFCLRGPVGVIGTWGLVAMAVTMMANNVGILQQLLTRLAADSAV